MFIALYLPVAKLSSKASSLEEYGDEKRVEDEGQSRGQNGRDFQHDRQHYSFFIIAEGKKREEEEE